VKQLGLTHHLHNFVSGEFRRHAWYAGPEWNDRQLRLYHEYLRKFHRTVYVAPRVDNENGGFYIFEIMSIPATRPPVWVPFLPDAESVFRTAKSYADTRRFPEAIAEYGRLFNRIPPVGAIAGYMAVMYQRMEDWEKAFRTAEPYVKAGMVDCNGLPVYGEAAVNLRRLDAADWALRRCLSIYPGRRDANRVNLSLVYVYRAGADVRAGRMSKATANITEAEVLLSPVSTEREPRVADPRRQTRAMILGLKADIAASFGRRPEAARLYEEAMRLAPDVPEYKDWKKKSGRIFPDPGR
jgi:tetratricopeptide (TPR) repeat protein